MLRRTLGGGLIVGSIGVGFQLIRGLLVDSEPLWDTGLAIAMVLIGLGGGYLDHRRSVARTHAGEH